VPGACVAQRSLTIFRLYRYISEGDDAGAASEDDDDDDAEEEVEVEEEEDVEAAARKSSPLRDAIAGSITT
jgi:hypothetical protein